MNELLFCLAMNIYHEARGEPFTGQIAIAEVVLTRMKDPRWPSTGCDVIWQPFQFSWTTNHVRSRTQPTVYSEHLAAARTAMLNTDFAQGADHYHTIDIIPPDWADDLDVVNVIGNHIFYRSSYGDEQQ